MSLSFPVSPAVGQMYNGLIWDGVKWASPQGPAGLANIVLEVALNNNQTGITAGAWNTVKYDTVITDRQNAYVPSTGLFTPRQAGVYVVSATVAFAQTAGGQYGIAITKNGLLTQGETQANRTTSSAAIAGQPLSLSALVYCNGITDTISVQAVPPSGTTTFGSSSAVGFAINMVATLLQVGPQGPAGTISPGNRVLLSRADVSSAVASVDFFQGFDGTYEQLELAAHNVLTSVENVMQLRFSADGSTFDAGATSYIYMWKHVASNNTEGILGGSGGGINTGPAIGITAANMAFTGVYRINLGLNRTSLTWQHQQHNSGTAMSITGAGEYTTGVALGVRALIATASIARGTFILYGIKK